MTHVSMTESIQPAISMADLLENFVPFTPKRNTIVNGEIVAITQQGALVHLGAKTESLVPTEEVVEAGLAVGQRADFLVLATSEDDSEPALLSLKAARAWTKAKELAESGASADAIVRKIVKARGSDHVSGAIADLDGQRGFIPASHLGCRYNVAQQLVGTTVPVKVIKVDLEARDLILSHKLAQEEQRQAFFNAIERGQILPGTVTNLVEYGAFIDLGMGVSGLVHRSELSNNRGVSPADVLSTGQEVEVLVIDVRHDNRKVDLSLKRVAQTRALSHLEKGKVVEGKVARIVDFGAFIDLGGIDGLLHRSELPNGHRDPKSALTVGETVRVLIIELDVEAKKVGLSLKQVPTA